MKKALLLLFLFLSLTIYSQPPGMFPPLTVCDDASNDGLAVFDLTSTIPTILDGLDPAIHEVHFYPSDTDSANNTNEITTPNAYVNTTPGLQTIGVRIINTALSEIHLAGMNLVVNAQSNAGTDGSITVCETSSTTIDLYSLITGEQSGGTWTRTTGVGGTFNASAGTYTPGVGATTSTFTYTVTGLAPCSSDSSVTTINIIAQPNAGNDGNIAVCDTSTTIVDLFSVITGEQSGGTWVRTRGSGGIFNASAGTYTHEIGATTSSFTYVISGILPCIDDSSVATVFVNPPANPATLQFCDVMELPIYNLHDADNQITGGATGFTITYHETLTDAEIGANAIPNGGYVPIVTPVQTLFASVISPATSCRSITTLTLNTHNCASSCPAPINLTTSAVTDTSFAVSWDILGGTGTCLISLVPQGSPPPSDSDAVAINSTIFYFTGLSPNACYTIYVKIFCPSSTISDWATLNICMPNCADSGACSEVLVLDAFLDSNNNGVKDTGEVDFNHGNFVYQVNDSGSNQYGTSNDGSYYIFDSDPSNSYDISFALNADFSTYYTSAVSHNNITLPDGSGENYLYFPIVNVLPHVDAQVTISPYGQPRPGFTYGTTIYYQNNGSQTIPSGTLTFTKHPTISIASVSQTGTTPTATGFTYDFTNLAPFEVRYIQVTFLVPTIPTVNLGDLVTNTVTVQIDNDINLSNNSSSTTQTVVGSYDPNDKMESHGGKIVHSTFTSNDYLYYTIQFENTGTANAEFVRVEDALNSQLDENTFEMISASHNVDTKRVGTQLTWHFYNIDLPPTSSNPIGSHGFVSFKIKPKAGYAIGDVIPNTASIYFDYNPAIVTNQFDTEFVLTLGNASFSSTEFNLYPNPANGFVHITQNNNLLIDTIQFYDITGKTVKSILNVNNVQTSIDVSALAKGVYFVEIIAENYIKKTKKLIIQ
ncbi:T9SS type A sorting domain-containing protein [Flavobacterium sangjuense]|uniref:Fibronectin type-III domain-containing protein n=1 Tax=Flavobacterium sangjuense TaxID=2518177 RepID=A0A4P7PT86_9FLAO|nr:T9SS type A sorting domain-containing protein [Flavobacterium sangjuense]QBZ97460.1 hypothetical protein GS03_00951 [Flavobacterium sangjuense]